ncbi:hypothetical protein [Methanomethylovorans sp.]|uniref:hypothetical protein n=1 Tax=Methanomethylovorans sp. TaxID=2758717 RepID=UPI00345E4584
MSFRDVEQRIHSSLGLQRIWEYRTVCPIPALKRTTDDRPKTYNDLVTDAHHVCSVLFQQSFGPYGTVLRQICKYRYVLS